MLTYLLLSLPLNSNMLLYFLFSLDKADKTSHDYDIWCKDADETKEIIESEKQEVETSSQPTSDPEERKKHVTTITVSVLCMH